MDIGKRSSGLGYKFLEALKSTVDKYFPAHVRVITPLLGVHKSSDLKRCRHINWNHLKFVATYLYVGDIVKHYFSGTSRERRKSRRPWSWGATRWPRTDGWSRTNRKPRTPGTLSLRILIWLKHFCLKNLIYTTFSILRHQSTCSTKRRPYVW